MVGQLRALIDNSTAIKWAKGLSSLANAMSNDDGLTNTNSIVTAEGTPINSYAAGLCQEYGGGNYHDWFLPAKSQLNCLYNHQIAVGNFTSTDYWSSTQISDSSASAQNFSNDLILPSTLINGYHVRCVRALTL